MPKPPKMDSLDVTMEHGRNYASQIMERAIKGDAEHIAGFATAVLVTAVGEVFGTLMSATPDPEKTLKMLLETHAVGIARMARLKLISIRQAEKERHDEQNQ